MWWLPDQITYSVLLFVRKIIIYTKENAAVNLLKPKLKHTDLMQQVGSYVLTAVSRVNMCRA